MSPELEVLDQLAGGDLPLHVINGLFHDNEHCKRALRASLETGEILILDSDRTAIPVWRLRELETNSDAWSPGSGFRVEITELGCKRIQ